MITRKQKRRMLYFLMIIYVYICATCKVKATEIDKHFISLDLPSAVVIDAKTGRILYGQNENDARAMASLTKIMTTIVLIENSNLDDIVTAPNEVDYIGGSLMRLKRW